MTRGIYVTGTDTGVGKTHVSCALLRSMRGQGEDAVGMKPVASGCEPGPEGLRNADALNLIEAGPATVRYDDVNPYAFAEPIAPHLAAADAGSAIGLARIVAAHRRLCAASRFVVIEGVGGWLAPLGETLMQADLVNALDVPVVLVVGLRLGCLNHALLSVRAIAHDGCHLSGWIANRIDPDMLRADDNIATLRGLIQAPLLGIVEYGATRALAAASLDRAAGTLIAATSNHHSGRQ